MAKLQLALDLLDFSKAIKITEQTLEYIDIIEIGTPFLKKFGIHSIYPTFKIFNKEKLIDTKTTDAIFLEAEIASILGKWFTVLANSPEKVIKKIPLVKVRYNIKIAVDTIGVKSLRDKVKSILKYKPDLFVIHKGVDEEKFNPDILEEIKDLDIKIAVAGGIDKDIIKELKNYKDLIDVVIVGRYITQSKDPKEKARELKKEIKKWLG